MDPPNRPPKVHSLNTYSIHFGHNFLVLDEEDGYAFNLKGEV